jgi:hypothetical protein
MQQKISLYLETNTKEKLSFQVYITENNKLMITDFLIIVGIFALPAILKAL